MRKWGKKHHNTARTAGTSPQFHMATTLPALEVTQKGGQRTAASWSPERPTVSSLVGTCWSRRDNVGTCPRIGGALLPGGQRSIWPCFCHSKSRTPLPLPRKARVTSAIPHRHLLHATHEPEFGSDPSPRPGCLPESTPQGRMTEIHITGDHDPHLHHCHAPE